MSGVDNTAMKFLMFPGQGSQYPGMGKLWYENFSEAKLAFEEASDFCGINLKKLCFDGSDDDLKQTEVTQPAILTTTVAAFRSMNARHDLKIKEALYAGHSLGEYSALVCMGTISLGEAARLVNHRGLYMQEAVPAGKGAMAALVFRPKVDGSPLARALCEEISASTGRSLSVANYNSPEQIVIAGETIAVRAAGERALQEPYGARKVVELPVSAPFHCALMKPAADRLSLELRAAPWKPVLGAHYVANVDAQIHEVEFDGADQIAARLTAQITGSVRWVESVQAALAAGATRAFEIGPGRVLSGLSKRISLSEKTLEAFNIDTPEDFKNVSTQF